MINQILFWGGLGLFCAGIAGLWGINGVYVTVGSLFMYISLLRES